MTKRAYNKHGLTNHPAYYTWKGMHFRCSNPKSNNYHLYGARGIKVCERWNLLANFVADMGAPPLGKTLDRINNDGNYEPSNCRWATQNEQNSNKSTVNLLEHDGVKRTGADWARMLNVDRSLIYYWTKKGKTMKEIASRFRLRAPFLTAEGGK